MAVFIEQPMPTMLRTVPARSEGGYTYTMNCIVQESPLVDTYNCMVGKQISFYPDTPSQTQSTPKKIRHRRTFKELAREISCPVESCNRKYASRSSLSTHMRLKHSKEAQRQQEEEDAKRKKEQSRPPKPLKPKAAPAAFAFPPPTGVSGVMLPPTTLQTAPSFQVPTHQRASICSSSSLLTSMSAESMDFDEYFWSTLEEGSSDLESLFESEISPAVSPIPYSPGPHTSYHISTPPAFRSCDDLTMLANPAMPRQIIITTAPMHHYPVGDVKMFLHPHPGPYDTYGPVQLMRPVMPLSMH